MYDQPKFLLAGDQSLVVELGDVVNPSLNRRVHNLTSAIEEAGLPGIIDLVPTYRSLLVYYDNLQTSLSNLQSEINNLLTGLSESPLHQPRLVHIPTRYGGDFGPDLSFVAAHTKLKNEEIIALHSQPQYLVYMMGFNTGFPYLGGMPEQLATPRLETPRTKTPAGSIGIAESQTGVYPVASPGGWRLIGKTPMKLFDPLEQPPALLKAGDYLKFVPIDTDDEYAEIEQRVATDEYTVTVELLQ